MKFDFSLAIQELDGTIVKQGNGSDLLLSHVCCTALINNDTALSVDEKFHLGMLAQELYGASEFDISPEDLVTIRKCIGKVYGPLIVSKAYNLLDA